MTGASNPRFARKLLGHHMINKAPLKHAHDDEVRMLEPPCDQWLTEDTVELQLAMQLSMGCLPSLCLSS
jgi:hypothetical protein